MWMSAGSQQALCTVSLWTHFFLVAEYNLQNMIHCIYIYVYMHIARFLVFSFVWLQVKHKSCVKISLVESLSFLKMKCLRKMLDVLNKITEKGYFKICIT